MMLSAQLEMQFDRGGELEFTQPNLPVVGPDNWTKLFHLDELKSSIFSQRALRRFCANFHGGSASLAPHVYGGLSMCQAMRAAELSVNAESKVPASFHCLFVSLPSNRRPIEYEVQTVRDARGRWTRAVRGIQNGRTILFGTADFTLSSQRPIVHNTEMPSVPPPERLPDYYEFCEQRIADLESGKLDLPERLGRQLRRRMVSRDYSIVDVRPVDPDNYLLIRPFSPPLLRWWLRARHPIGEAGDLHHLIVAFVSDMYTFGAIHFSRLSEGRVARWAATATHTLHFHRHDFRADDWFLFEGECQSADDDRGWSVGRVWSRDGQLIASTAQAGVAHFDDTKAKI